MDAAYFEAAIPNPYTIFGARLLPLSIGRYRLLKRFGCAFVDEKESTATFEDLILGIVICSMTVKGFLEFLQSGTVIPEMKRFGERIRKEVEHDPHFNLFSKFGLFQAYILESSKCPKYWNELDDDRESSAHWSHNLEMSLREMGYTSKEIDEGPLSKALADYFKHAENQGAIRLMSEDEISQGDANAKLFEQLSKGGVCPVSN
jgi:hypothetical protein